jgi:predicted nucleic acid-binding protein
MRLYIDLNCFNRPFDDQGQERVRKETEAVLSVLTRIVEGKDTLLWSSVMSFENDKHPKADRRDEIALWEGRSERFVSVTESLEQRARQIVRQGIAVLDAAHLAAAEIGGAEIVLTCDDVLVRRAARLGLALRVLNPVAYFNEVKDNG